MDVRTLEKRKEDKPKIMDERRRLMEAKKKLREEEEKAKEARRKIREAKAKARGPAVDTYDEDYEVKKYSCHPSDEMMIRLGY